MICTGLDSMLFIFIYIMKKEDLNLVKEFIDKGLEVINSITSDDFIFSRIEYFDKQKGKMRRCVIGWLAEKDYNISDYRKLCHSPNNLALHRLDEYLVYGSPIIYRNDNKTKTLTKNTPELNPLSTLDEVRLAWEFAKKNYEKMLNALV